MAQVRIKVDRREIARLLKGEGLYEGVARDIERRGQQVAVTAGPGHNAETFVGHDRVRCHIYADTAEAKLNEMRTRNLTQALDEGLR